MSDSVKSIRDCEMYDDNPFLEGVTSIQKRNKIISVGNSKLMVNQESGEAEGTAHFVQMERVDKERFVKVFHDNLKLLFGLKPASCKLVFYIMEQVDQNKAMFILDKDKLTYGKSKIMSRATLYSSIVELINNKIIARSKVINVYYLNPAFFFNGNRVIFSSIVECSDNGKDLYNKKKILPNTGFDDETGENGIT